VHEPRVGTGVFSGNCFRSDSAIEFRQPLKTCQPAAVTGVPEE